MVNFTAIKSNVTKIRQGRILGGNEVSLEDFPYQVSVGYIRHLCGGSIISEYVVLTAAHCFDDLNIYDKYVVGSIEIRRGSKGYYHQGQTHTAVKVILYNDYKPNRKYYHDIALVKVYEAFIFDDTTKIIKLIEPGTILSDGISANVSGWGITTNDEDAKISMNLMAVEITIMDISKCFRVSEGYIDDRQICAGDEEGKKDICNGDSGGPLVIYRDKVPYQVGIVSYGPTVCGRIGRQNT